jgi:hypothetical protein
MNDMKPIAATAAKHSKRAATLMVARQWHSFSAAFFAPAILFFSVTGAFQTFNLHKPLPGYQPPAVLQALASMHKNQNLNVKYVDPAGAKPAKAARPDDPPKPVRPPLTAAAQLILKIFTALVSVGLAATTILGLYMAWATTRRRAVLLWFAAGLVLPMLVMLAV